jgi:hypothetical protein
MENKMNNEALTDLCIELLYESDYATIEVMVAFYRMALDKWGAYYVGWDDAPDGIEHLHDIHEHGVIPHGEGRNHRLALEDLHNKMVLFNLKNDPEYKDQCSEDWEEHVSRHSFTD